VLPLVAATGFAADVSQHLALCGTTWRLGDKGATNDMIVQSLRLQCGEREAHAAEREDFVFQPLGVIRATTQLIRAAITNNLPRVRQLIQLGAPLDIGDKRWSGSALHWASQEGHEHVVKALLDGKYEGKGADIEKPEVYGWTPLMRACSNGHEAAARLLLSRGANVAARDCEGQTALSLAQTVSMRALLKAHGATE
jgi:hypothetical protein